MKNPFSMLLHAVLSMLCYFVSFIQVFFIDPLFSFIKGKGDGAYTGPTLKAVAHNVKAWMYAWIDLLQLTSGSSTKYTMT